MLIIYATSNVSMMTLRHSKFTIKESAKNQQLSPAPGNQPKPQISPENQGTSLNLKYLQKT